MTSRKWQAEQMDKNDTVYVLKLEATEPSETHATVDVYTKFVEDLIARSHILQLAPVAPGETAIRVINDEISADRQHWRVEFKVKWRNDPAPRDDGEPITVGGWWDVFDLLSRTLAELNSELPALEVRRGVLTQRAARRVLFLHDLAFFSRKIISHHDRLGIRALFWGAQLDAGTFLAHHEVSYEPGTFTDEPKILTKAMDGSQYPRTWPSRPLGENAQIGIYLTAEWDRQRLYLYFVTKESRKVDGRATETNPNIVRLEIRLSAIHRVVVDLASSRRTPPINALVYQPGAVMKDKRAAILYLHMSGPAELRRQFAPLGNKLLEHSRFLRYDTFTRGRLPKEFPYNRTFDAIAESPVLALDFTHDGLSKMYEVISRLRVMTRAHIEFASLEIHDLQATTGAKYAMLDQPMHPVMQAGATINQSPAEKWMVEPHNKLTDAIKKAQERLDEHWVKICPHKPADNAPEGEHALWRARSQGPSARFRLLYALEMLWSRGALFIDQFAISLPLDKPSELGRNTMPRPDEKWKRFLVTVAEHFHDDDKLTLYAIDELINWIDEQSHGKQLGDIANEFDEIYDRLSNDPAQIEALDRLVERDGYVKIRKVIFTLTRRILMPSEVMLGNRVLREFDLSGDNAIRAIFREDTKDKIHAKSGGAMASRAIRDRLVNGETIAGRKFIWAGASNSQMRDAGAYFINEAINSDVMWESLGDLAKIQPISKQMARMGQCFTQSRVCADERLLYEELDENGEPIQRTTKAAQLWENRCRVVPDVEGGSAPHTQKAYIFTDGVGCIRGKRAKELSRLLGYQNYCVPSCLQFRYRGAKGILVVNPALDDQWEFADRLGLPDVEDEHQKAGVRCDVELRPSQIKFDAPIGSALLEIVKHSGPTSLCLNRPFISILDQICDSETERARMTTHVEYLLDADLDRVTTALFDERAARNRLAEMPQRIDIDQLQFDKGFRLTKEPFFRSLLLAAFRRSMRKEMKRMNIAIDTRHGRAMFGVTDETGQLQYGQVFVQYTRDARIRQPAAWADRRIHIGPVLLTKNPCVVAGDVRMFEAVDIPELHHLCDVLVFSQHGPRSQPDEMAGSDLDGDEYVVVWDERLFFGRNHPPFTAPPPEPSQEEKDEDGDGSSENSRSPSVSEMSESERAHRERADFFYKYQQQTSIGMVSNAHLCTADMYGIGTKVAMSLAHKCTLAVDFTKSGVAAPPLVTKWTTDTETGEQVPPERAERAPDFMEKIEVPSYRSNRLLGRLFRSVRDIDHVVRDFEERYRARTTLRYTVDPVFLAQPGWERYKDRVAEALRDYNARIRGLMQAYGVESEAEMFADAIINIRNRLSDREEHDMSLFTTNYMIQQQVSRFFFDERARFFEEFGGFEGCTEPARSAFHDGIGGGGGGGTTQTSNSKSRVCVQASEGMRAKAVCCLQLAYETAENEARVAEPVLSFGWIAYDVLVRVREDHMLRAAAAYNPNQQSDGLDDDTFVSNTTALRLERMVVRFATRQPQALREFERAMLADSDPTSLLPYYYRRYRSLDERQEDGLLAVGFWLHEWVKEKRLFVPETGFRPEHLQLMLVMAAIGAWGARGVETTHAPIAEGELLERLDATADDAELERQKDDTRQIRPGAVLLNVIRTLGSATVRRAQFIDFAEHLCVPVLLCRREWVPMSEAVAQLYIRLALEDGDLIKETNAEVVADDDDLTIGAAVQEHELETIAFELPRRDLAAGKLRMFERVLTKATRVSDISIRHFDRNVVLASARGTHEAAHRLSRLLTPSIIGQVDTQEGAEQLATAVARRLYEKAVEYEVDSMPPREYFAPDEQTAAYGRGGATGTSYLKNRHQQRSYGNHFERFFNEY